MFCCRLLQRDAEHADIEKERKEQMKGPEAQVCFWVGDFGDSISAFECVYWLDVQPLSSHVQFIS